MRKNGGGRYKGKEIISPQKLCELPEDTIIIIGSTFYEDINNKLKKYNIGGSRVYYIEYKLKLNNFIITDFNKCISLISDAYQRKLKITFYGQEQVVLEVKRKIELLDICNVDILTRNCKEEDGTILRLSYFDWDNRICLITDDINEESVKLIEETDITSQSFYWLRDCQQYYCYDATSKYKYIPDPTLGFSAISLDGKVSDVQDYPGFIKFEYVNGDDINKCVIMILGGSTSQGYFAREVSWGELLSKILTEKEIPHTIYLGAIGGYSNIQELLKLMRDGIILKADIIVNYSGVNNMNEYIYPEHPFIHPYQLELFEWIQKNSKKTNLYSKDYSQAYVNYGMKATDYNSFEYWLLIERLMNSICRELSIKFKAFLQPTLFSKLKYDEDEVRLMLGYYKIIANTIYDIHICKKDTKYDEITDETIKNAIMFRRNIADYKEKYSDWLVDLSDIFDDEHGIYMDYCHVYETGNKIIARHIYDTLKEDIAIVLKLKSKGNC